VLFSLTRTSIRVVVVLLTLCKSKLHRATVTRAELHYEGSITIDAELLDAAGIVPFERVQVVNIANGARFETYAIAGPRRSGTVCVNGAAARLVHPGDLIIVITYAAFTPDEARAHRPVIVLLDAANAIRDRITADQASDAEFLADG
jgi:aspartate 1-decarboxylase